MTTLIRFAPLALAVMMMQTPATEPGFTQLFNGKDFTGWKLSNPAAFTIDDGAIVGRATRSTTDRSWITRFATSS